MFEKLRAFHRPTSVAQALRLMRSERGRGRYVAGGTDLVVAGDRGLSFVVDLSRLPLGYIRRKGGGWAIGATTTMAEIEHSPALRRLANGILAEAAGTCGSIQNRNTATIGGNLANASPAADTAPPLLALDASVVLAGPAGRAGRAGRRTVPLERFFSGAGRTVMDGALLVEIVIPAPPPGRGAARATRGGRPARARGAAGGRAAWSFHKLGRLESDIAVVNAAAGVAVDRTGRCAWARLAVGAAAPTPLRAYRAEKLLLGRPLDDETVDSVAHEAAREMRPVSDLRASAEYRREMTRVLVGRALIECAARLGGRP